VKESFSRREQDITECLRQGLGSLDPSIYDLDDVDKADRDLTTYLSRLEEARGQEPALRERMISQAIREVCKDLSAFHEKSEWEFRQGFLFMGPTRELADLILDAASDAGWTRPATTPKKPVYMRFTYKPTWDWDLLERLYGDQKFDYSNDKQCFTADAELVIGWGSQYIHLLFDSGTSQFEYDANPRGEPSTVPLLDVHADERQLSFAVLTNQYKSITFQAQTLVDQAFFSVFSALHGKGVAPGLVLPSDHGFAIETIDGELTEFQATTYDNNHGIVPDTLGLNPWLKYADIDGFLRFVLVGTDDQDMYVVSNLRYHAGHLLVATDDGGYDFPIRTIPDMNTFLKAVLSYCEPNDDSLYDICASGDVDLLRTKLMTVTHSELSKSTLPLGTPLHAAALGGHLGIVDMLIGAGADLEARDYQQNTVLGACITAGKLNMARHLLERGADPNAKGADGRNALSQLICSGWDRELANDLVRSGFNVNQKSRYDHLLIDAANTNNVDVVNFLFENGIDRAHITSALYHGIVSNQVGAIRLLLNRGGFDRKLMYGTLEELGALHQLSWAPDHGGMIRLLIGWGVDFSRPPRHRVDTFISTDLSPADYMRQQLDKEDGQTYRAGYLREYLDIIESA